MEYPERRLGSNMKPGVVVVIVLAGIAVVALVCLILTEFNRDKTPTVTNTTEQSCNVTNTTTELTPTNPLKYNLGECFSESFEKPCNNLYQYVCGNRTNECKTKSAKKGMAEVEKDIKLMWDKDFYNKEEWLDMLMYHHRAFAKFKSLCIKQGESEDDLEGIMTIKKEYFRDAGDWPILEGERSNTTWNLEKLWKVESIFKHLFLESGGLIKITEETEGEDLLIKIDKPALRLQINDPPALMKYWKNKLKVAHLFGVNQKLAMENIPKAVEFEFSLNELIKSTQNKTNSQFFISTEALLKNESFKHVSWKTLLWFVDSSNKSIKYNIEDPEYLIKLKDIIEEKNIKDIANSIFWRIAEAVAPYVSKDFRATYSQHHSKNWTSRDNFCIETVSRHMTPVVMYNLMKNLGKTKKEVAKIVYNIRRAMNSINSTTKDKEDKCNYTMNYTLEDLNNITVHIGYPADLLDKTEMDNYYKKLFHDKKNNLFTSSFLNAHLELSKLYHNTMITKNNDPKYYQWMKFDDLITPTASNNMKQKYIVINLGLLKPPSFDPSMPLSKKYGSLGFVIAEQFINVSNQSVCREAFDVVLKAKKNSELQEITTPNPYNSTEPSTTTATQFKVTSTTLEFHHTVTTNSHPVTPTSQPYTEEQLFLISAVNTMCLNYKEIKVNEIMNLTEFKKAFECEHKQKL